MPPPHSRPSKTGTVDEPIVSEAVASETKLPPLLIPGQDLVRILRAKCYPHTHTHTERARVQ